MGFHIAIGNVVRRKNDAYDPINDPDEPEFVIEVDPVNDPRNAPLVYSGTPGDHSNERSPSHTAWTLFARMTGTFDFFFQGPCFVDGPRGVAEVTQETVSYFSERVRDFQKKYPHADASKDHKHYTPEDGSLERLLWLEYWSAWALGNCESPGIVWI